MTRPAIGFVIVTYKQPEQILRLVHTLNRVYGDPPIAVHHDFGQCDPGVASFPANVAFVRPNVATGWGTFGVAEGTVRALQILYGSGEGPRWFTLLSSCDYPLQPAARVLADLDRGNYDAHIDHTRISATAPAGSWERICADRYLRASMRLPWRKNATLHVRQPLLAAPFLPWRKHFHCYAGSQWFSANWRAARAILQAHRTNHRLRHFYEGVQIVDESYFQTILANTDNLHLNNNNWRYVDWGTGGAHPRLLTHNDLEQCLNSRHHFARKFEIASGSEALDAIDHHLARTAPQNR